VTRRLDPELLERELERLGDSGATRDERAALAVPAPGPGEVEGTLSRLAAPGARPARVALLARLQATLGNTQVLRLLRQAEERPPDGATPRGEEEASAGAVVSEVEEFEPEEFENVPDEHLHIAMVGPGEQEAEAAEGEERVAAPAAFTFRFFDLGRVGTARYGDRPAPGARGRPHAFTDGGRTATTVWGGGAGAGARGNEGAGSVQSQVAPTYESRKNPTGDADAWVRAGTGTIQVTRSWTGINSGDQGNGWFLTAGATTRINNHEVAHVNNSRGHYNTNITPLEARVADRTLGLNVANTEAQAIAALRALIRWPETVTAFQTADRTDNQPNGTVDTNDVNSGTWPVDAGPGTVAGTAFQHRVRLPAEANPAP
jgi:hypothetical protein